MHTLWSLSSTGFSLMQTHGVHSITNMIHGWLFMVPVNQP